MAAITITPAKAEDWPAIEGLFIHIARWLQSQGSKQWQGLLKGEDNHHTQERIDHGQVYVGKTEDLTLAGCFILYENASPWDRALWKDQADLEAFYLHRLAVHRDFKGQRLSQDFIQAAKQICVDQGKAVLRLDCRADIEPLNQLYLSQGFQKIGCVDSINDGISDQAFHLYEWQVQDEAGTKVPK